MGYLGQVLALVRKDLQVARASKKSSALEVLIPLIVGAFCGLMIFISQLVRKSFNEYDDLSSLSPLSTYGDTWVGVMNNPANLSVIAAAYASALAHFPNIMVQYFSNSTDYRATFEAFQDNFTYATMIGIDVDKAAHQEYWKLSTASAPNSSFYQSALLYRAAEVLYTPPSQGGASSASTVSKTLTYRFMISFFNFRAVLSSTGAFFLIYAFVPGLVLSAGRLVEEKRLKLRETLKVMGMHDSAYLVSNFVSGFLRMMLGSALISVILAAFQAIEPASIAPMMGLFILFVFSLIAFAQIMPALFSVNMWSNLCCIVFLLVSASVSSISTAWGAGGQVGVCFLSPIALYYGVLHYLSNGSVVLHVGPGIAALMLVVDTVIYVTLGYYIYSVSPGDFGVPKHPLFFIRWIWHKDEPVQSPEDTTVNASFGTPGDRVVLRDLVKQFGSDSPAVNRLSLSIRRGEIFALLGHNGAGKTTTISILTGMITPTTYARAKVDGMDIATQMDAIRRSVGLCPQFDVLINDLSARQHMELFASIKGNNVAKDEVTRLLRALDLPDTNKASSTFSGGMKRRLSVGNAIVGGASLLFLDEPSSGLDPMSRRQLWDLLREERDKGKTLVLTTHFMEEADYLGDRIGIMSHGKLFCCDTAQKLKETYGVGYYLTLVKNQSEVSDVEQATALIQTHLPEATLHHQSSGDATYLLPLSGLEKFGPMMTDLEARIPRLGFHSYGVSMNSLEDVFVSISEKEEEARKQASPLKKNPPATLNTSSVNGTNVEEYFKRATEVPYWTRVRSHAKTVFDRKVMMLRRNRRMQLMILMFPLVFIAAGFLTMQPQDPSISTDSGSGIALPDYNNMNIVFGNLRDHADGDRILAQFRPLYQNLYPSSALTIFVVNDYKDYASASFLPMHSVSYIGGFDTPKVAVSFLIHNVNLAAPQPVINYTFSQENKYSSTLGFQMIAMFELAVERAAGNTNAVLPEVLIEPQASTAPTPAPVFTSVPPKEQGGKIYGYISVGIYTVVAIVQLVSNCVIPMADEMNRRIYHTSRAHGMTAAGYFLGNLMFDLLCCIFPVFLLLIGILIKGIAAFQGPVLIIILIAGFIFEVHVLLLGYILVVRFDSLKPVTYTAIMQGVALASLGGPYIFALVLKAWKLPDSFVDSIKPIVLSLFPASAFYHVVDITGGYGTTAVSHALSFQDDKPGLSFLFLILELAVPIFLVTRLASGARVKAPTRPAKTLSSADDTPLLASRETAAVSMDAVSSEPEDPDVAQERQRVAHGNAGMIVTENLRKVFGYKGQVGAKVALRDLSLGMKKGECFGLLGPNGAGKSTTCKLILKELEPTAGTVQFPNVDFGSETSITRDTEFLHCRLGVCQQGDTLWECLDAREHMDQYLRFRLTTQYNKSEWSDYIENTITKVQLGEAESRWAGRFSGGMKRKLIVSIAMYTGALSVFLDEPSTGMDPFARRALWQVILEALSNDRCVVLTTHSMEEADAVCSRIGIITDGAMRCIGSGQHLKNRFGSGYVATLSVAEDANTAMIDAEMTKHFGSSTKLGEVLGPMRRYEIGALPSLAQAFTFISSQCAEWHVKQYSITQTSSLEQIFLSFVGTEAMNNSL